MARESSIKSQKIQTEAQPAMPPQAVRWSVKYGLVWNRLLGLKLFSEESYGARSPST